MQEQHTFFHKLLWQTSLVIGLLIPGAYVQAASTDQLLVNPEFIEGLDGWECSNCSEDNIFTWPSGMHSFNLGEYGAYATLSQTVTLPKRYKKIYLDYFIQFESDDFEEDYFAAFVTDPTTGDILKYDLLDADYEHEYAYGENRRLSLSGFSGRTVTIHFVVNNDAILFTSASLDSISLLGKTNSTVTGIVNDENGKPVKHASVLIKDADSNTIGRARTNLRGKFFIDSIVGSKKNMTVIIKHGGARKSWGKKIKYGEDYNFKFLFDSK